MIPIRIETNNNRYVEVGFDPKFKNIGLRISGGADSAIVGYMLCEFILENLLENDTTIIPITINQNGKAYQIERSTGVINFYKSFFPEIKFGNHYTAISEVESRDYTPIQKKLSETLFQDGIIDCLFLGITANPPLEELNKLGFAGRFPPDREYEVIRKTFDDNRYRPLTNAHKQDVATLYDYYNLKYTLFPLTRSCESYNMDITKNMTRHCGRCYHCTERYWGFGRFS